ncbi:unnamed protein product, partial [Staurois parvus]
TGFRPKIPLWHLAIAQVSLLPTRTCCFVFLCTTEKYKAACLPSKTHIAHNLKQHTVNPLITPDVNPFLPSVISTVSMLFISTDHCIGVMGCQ